MSRILLVHGIAQQYGGPETLRSVYVPALRDGVSLARGSLPAHDVGVAFYGDVFRPSGSRSTSLPEYEALDLDDPLELDLLYAWWTEAAAQDPTVPGPRTRTRARTPQWIQRALYALSASVFFGGLSDRALIGSLKQVRAYLLDPVTRESVRERVRAAIHADTEVLVGHSLGSVIAYEILCGPSKPPVHTFISLGSPLGIPRLIFDRLIPPPSCGLGQWPNVRQWTNVADRNDVVALAKQLAPRFGDAVEDVLVDNGAKAHDIRPYLTAAETGHAILHGLPDMYRS
jgi:hypothetical protein